MNECSNKKYREMVHAYELGMLTETENEQFELHLLECPACREDILGFKEVASNLNRSSETSQLIEELAQPESDIPKNRMTRIWIPILTTAAIIIFLLVKPWDIQITPTKEALAEENRLAIMYFDNLADELDSLKLGRIASNLLITDLAESQFINVLSNERIQDILELIAFEDSSKLMGDISFEIAERSQSKWILNGSILQIKPNIVITSKLTSYPAGDVLGSQKIIGEKDEDIFSVIDRLTVQIKNDLSLPSDAFNEPDRKISEFTTESQKAYYYYMEGVENYLKYNTSKAIEYFDLAVEEDSTFAMAYYFLAATRDRNLIYKALEYSDNVSQLGKYYIEIFEASISGNEERNKYLLNALIQRYPDEKNAHLLLGRFAYNDNDYVKALEHFQIALDIDPIFKRAQNFLAYSYSGLNNFDSAITAINRYVELTPNEPNPYDSQGDIYARFGKLDMAIESYKRALDINPEFANSRLQLGLMHAFNGQYELADKTFDVIAYNPDNSLNVMVILSKAYIPIFQGAFDSSLTLMQIAIDSCNRVYPSFHFVRAQVYWQTGDLAGAIDEIEKAIRVAMMYTPQDRGMFFKPHQARLYAQNGDFAKAEEIAEEMLDYFDESSKDKSRYYMTVGSIELVKNNYEQALVYFDSTSNFNQLNFDEKYQIGLANLHTGRIDRAIDIFEKLTSAYDSDRAYYGIWSVKAHFYLGMAYERNENFNLAENQYILFLDNWGQSSTIINEVEMAKSRLKKIKNIL